MIDPNFHGGDDDGGMASGGGGADDYFASYSGSGSSARNTASSSSMPSTRGHYAGSSASSTITSASTTAAGGQNQRNNKYQNNIKTFTRNNINDAWALKQLQLSGRDQQATSSEDAEFLDTLRREQSDGRDGGRGGGGGGGDRSGPVIDLRVDRQMIPKFLKQMIANIVGDGGGGDTTTNLMTVHNRHRDIVLPVKDETSDFARLAKLGSETLRDLRRKKAERRNMQAAVGTQQSDMDALVRGGNQREMTQEELDQLQRRLRLEQFRNATEEERKKRQREYDDEDKQAMRNESRFDGGADNNNKSSTGTKEDESSTNLFNGAAQSKFAQENRIEDQRKLLPIFACRNELLKKIREHPVVVLAGETGSGKTTQIAQYLYEAGYAQHGMMIGCTQPRRMAAVGVAHRVANEVGCPIGETVGYAIRLEDKSSERTKVKFLTEGVLLREVIADPCLFKYSVIIVDEAHERSVNTDVLLGIFKKILLQREDFRLVVTSATMDISKFARFFDNAPIFTVPGRVFDVETRYEPGPVSDYVDQAVFRTLEIHTENLRSPGDVLIFMSGEDDVEGTCELLKERLLELSEEMVASLMILPCYSVLPTGQQRQIFAPPPEGVRKVIVATNIAETSLTIDGIKYVIDAGFHKCKVYRPGIGMNTLQLYPVSVAQARQRQGRAGRTAAGLCHRLYSELQFQRELLPAPVPEIQRSSIDAVILLLKSIGVRDVGNFAFIDPPPRTNVMTSLYHLWLLDAINDDGEVTVDGKRLASFPAEPPLARVLLESIDHECVDECVTIAAMLSVDAKSVFTAPRGQEDAARSAREKFFAPDSDHLTLLNVFHQFRANGNSKAWADENFLNHMTLRRAADIRIQFREHLQRDFKKLPSETRGKRQGRDVIDSTCGGDTDIVRKCFCYGFFVQAARRDKMSSYITLYNGVPCELPPPPHSALNQHRISPEYVIYNDFILTTKEYMSVVTAVEPEWLIEVSGGLFHPRTGTGSPAVLAAMVEAQRKKAAKGAQVASRGGDGSEKKKSITTSTDNATNDKNSTSALPACLNLVNPASTASPSSSSSSSSSSLTSSKNSSGPAKPKFVPRALRGKK